MSVGCGVCARAWVARRGMSMMRGLGWAFELAVGTVDACVGQSFCVRRLSSSNREEEMHILSKANKVN